MTSVPEILSTGLEIGSLYLVESKCSSDARMNDSWSVVGPFLALGVTSGEVVLKMKSCSALIVDLGISQGQCFVNVLTKERSGNCLGENGCSDTCALKNLHLTAKCIC